MSPARLAKRGLDVVVASLVLVATSPLVAVAAVCTVLEDGFPVLYRQDRPGRGGRPFPIAKLRSMRVHDTHPKDMGQVDGDHPLVTRTGRIIRRTKVDELPQLLSVLRGDMSLVGPRPGLLEQVDGYDAHQHRRLEVTPGLTGWAQVCGGVALPWPDRIDLDVWYVDHWSLRLDLRILVRTVRVILRGDAVDHQALAAAQAHARRPY